MEKTNKKYGWLAGAVGVLVVALLLALGLGFGFALVPAWKASRLSPMEALRYE